MDICHLKNTELEAKHQKYKGRVVLRGDIVKDDSGSYAVFTEQGSSASQMTAAKIMDIISRLPGCARQAADAVSAHTQVKMDDASTFLKNPKSENPDFWIRLPKHKWPKSWSSMEDPAFSRKESVRSSSAGQFDTGTRLGMFLTGNVDDIKLAGKTENTEPTRKIPMKDVFLEERHHFLTT